MKCFSTPDVQIDLENNMFSGVQVLIFVLFLNVGNLAYSKLTCNKNINRTEWTGCRARDNCYDFIIEEKSICPDNYLQKGLVINSLFPGPTIHVNKQSLLIVNVENRSPYKIAMHWHGLQQEKTLAADGVEMVTQYEISTNESFTYCMYIGNQQGTYMYHAHNRLYNLWLHGALIIPESFPSFWKSVSNFPLPLPHRHQYHLLHYYTNFEFLYHREEIIILGQLYHAPVDKLIDDLLVNGTRIPSPSSLLINGRSYGKWSQSGNEACRSAYSVIKIEASLTYRFRIINLSTELMMSFRIRDHKMKLLEMDGIMMNPVEVDEVVLHAAQRYSVLVLMNQRLDNYWMESKVVGHHSPCPENGLAIMHYVGAEDPTGMTTQLRNEMAQPLPISREWMSYQLYPHSMLSQDSVYPAPVEVDTSILIDFRFVKEPLYRFMLNGHHHVAPDIPYLYQLHNHINISEHNPTIFEIIAGQDVQFIFQNRVMVHNEECEKHPWHFHGRFFHVVAHGPDLFDPSKDLDFIDQRVRENNGQFEFRDVFVQYPHQTGRNFTIGEPCGWYAVRFSANNPGLWSVHCHITPHMLLGKMFLIWEHTEDNPWLDGE